MQPSHCRLIKNMIRDAVSSCFINSSWSTSFGLWFLSRCFFSSRISSEVHELQLQQASLNAHLWERTSFGIPMGNLWEFQHVEISWIILTLDPLSMLMLLIFVNISSYLLVDVEICWSLFIYVCGAAKCEGPASRQSGAVSEAGSFSKRKLLNVSTCVNARRLTHGLLVMYHCYPLLSIVIHCYPLLARHKILTILKWSALLVREDVTSWE